MIKNQRQNIIIMIYYIFILNNYIFYLFKQLVLPDVPMYITKRTNTIAIRLFIFSAEYPRVLGTDI